jgi:hypothetical protein
MAVWLRRKSDAQMVANEQPCLGAGQRVLRLKADAGDVGLSRGEVRRLASELVEEHKAADAGAAIASAPIARGQVLDPMRLAVGCELIVYPYLRVWGRAEG